MLPVCACLWDLNSGICCGIEEVEDSGIWYDSACVPQFNLWISIFLFMLLCTLPTHERSHTHVCQALFSDISCGNWGSDEWIRALKSVLRTTQHIRYLWTDWVIWCIFVVGFKTVLHKKVVSLLPVLLPQVHNSHIHLKLEIGLVIDIRIQWWFCLPPVPDLDKLVQQLQEFSLEIDNTMANLISCGRAGFRLRNLFVLIIWTQAVQISRV